MRERLLISMDLLFLGVINPLLLRAIRFHFPHLCFAFVINWIPEQAEDIYWILMDSHKVLFIEVPRQGRDEDVLIEIMALKDYQGLRLSADTRRKLQIALELMKQRTSSSGCS